MSRHNHATDLTLALVPLIIVGVFAYALVYSEGYHQGQLDCYSEYGFPPPAHPSDR